MQDSSAAGSFYWSLFGRTTNCCGLVQHVRRDRLERIDPCQNDGYTLHYPGDDDSMRSAVVALTQHAYRMSGQAPAFASSADAISQASLPIVACPQPALSPNR